LQAVAALRSKKSAKYGGQWAFLGQTTSHITSCKFRQDDWAEFSGVIILVTSVVFLPPKHDATKQNLHIAVFDYYKLLFRQWILGFIMR
jgi:hypothetical protein